jgi:site-specific recombinase XerD
MLRHTAATGWIEAGVATDVVQALLGHVAFTSTSVSLHANTERMRAAVEQTATRTGQNSTGTIDLMGLVSR